MIRGIAVKNVATYSSEGVLYSDLKKVNYFYGSNGSGKSTLSNVLKHNELFPDSRIDWVSQPLKTVVYNQKFVEENFHQDSDIKGIFTLGRESTEIKQAIQDKKELVDKLTEEIRRLGANLYNKQEEARLSEEEFINDCWKLKQKYDEIFTEAFSGYRNNKSKFMNRCKQTSTGATIYDFSDLQERAQKLFKGSFEKLPLFEKIKMDSLHAICNHRIFRTPILGKQEVDIAVLISKLAISDWVKQGHRHIAGTDGICPFCQQELPDGYKQKLDDYFNEHYETEMTELQYAVDLYKRGFDQLESQLQLLDKKQTTYLDISIIRQQHELIHSKHAHNLDLLKQKQNQPSQPVELLNILNFITEINDEVERANQQVKQHNAFLENRVAEENMLKAQIWDFILSENQPNHEKYVRKDFSTGRAIESLTNTLTQKRNEKTTLEAEIHRLEAQITSVIPSVNEMNRLLRAYHFTNFKFAHTQNQGNYRLIRSNGQDVNQTLSEGEKTFVTFLYFMHLLNGSNNSDLITENKVVVIDDPISSLDSNVLFIVSNLISKLIEDVRNNESNIVQLFLLTHNVYFHKEITFSKNRPKNGAKMADETFWIIRKFNDITESTCYNSNPIKSSYELMWQELKSADHTSSITVQNLIRRIIENYFKIYGNYSDQDIIEKFEEEEKVICKSLISWANDGSHFAGDDLYIEHPMDTVSKYLRVFEKIFVVTNHHAHYKMMMGIEETLESALDQTQVS
ncbi:AAA family ATPase [Paenibacillus glufosinatiresistens]|uniref:AAA family ATPase n=1 Tax=Paenibacillus glufosinatiresistens TaxID=3070657 RepID=UPI00286E4A80|nr:AAA family ATPase [Paenibacillus sp. YX.27]